MFALNASRLRSKRLLVLEIAGMSDWNSRRVWWYQVESNMMEEPEKGLPRNRKWTQTKSREYRRPLGRRATASHKTEAKAFHFPSCQTN
jgi:hypothetical protein